MKIGMRDLNWSFRTVGLVLPTLQNKETRLFKKVGFLNLTLIYSTIAYGDR